MEQRPINSESEPPIQDGLAAAEPDEQPVAKKWTEMTEAEQQEALRRAELLREQTGSYRARRYRAR